MKGSLRLLGFLDREFLLWGVAPCSFAVLVVGLFALPNYLRARTMQDDSQRLKAVTNETIVAQNNLRSLQGVVSALRSQRDNHCRPLAENVERGRLLAAITRVADGTVVREQSIRTGGIVPAEGIPEEYAVASREVTVDMTGTFDAVFSVIDAAEGVDQLVTTKSVEVSIIATPIEQAQTGTATVRALIVFNEWFQQPPRQAAPASASAAAPRGRP